jgi:hypothetical protein
LNADVSRRERFKALFGAIALAIVVMLVAPPVVQAATQAVKVKGKVKVADTDGDAIESKAIADMGLLAAEGSDGALAVRNFAGGGGFLGAADCTETDADGLVNTVSVGNAIVTGIIMTGTDATWTVTSAAIGGGLLPLLNFRTTTDNPNEFVGLGNGLTLTAPLTFTCTGTNGNIAVLGQ